MRLNLLGRYRHGSFGKSAAEICSYDAQSQRLFVVNGETASIDVLDVSQPSDPTLVASSQLKQLGSRPNSVAARGDVIAVAISADPKQQPGTVAFLDADGAVLNRVAVGSEPDMVTISPDGRWALTANEGEPTDDYAMDPPGSISLIDLSGGIQELSDGDVTTLGFGAFHDPSQLDASIRVIGPDVDVEESLEPEYIAVSPDSTAAWVVLQEANALAVVDLNAKQIEKLVSFGFKDHSHPENALDASDKDDGIHIQPWPVKGMYQPDAIMAFAVDDEVLLVTANEGDHRNFSAFRDDARVADLSLDPRVFPNGGELKRADQLGRLKVATTDGDVDGDGLFEELYSFGARSFSVWTTDGELVFDSGSEFERIIANRHPQTFNADHESDKQDGRSDSKGPEPEGLAVGEIEGRRYAFIGLERHSGIMIYDLQDPRRPQFVDYVLTRDGSTGDPVESGDLGPEGVTFIAADVSPTGTPLLAVAYEISGTTAIFEIQDQQPLVSQ